MSSRVLDKGFVRLVESLGDDMAVVRAARVSYGGKESKGEEADKRLIKYLLKNKHTSPFEHVVFTFHVKCPIFVARQWMRHRTWSFNEISARYTEMKDDFYFPANWRAQDTKNKQGSVGEIEDWAMCLGKYGRGIEEAIRAYNSLLEMGVAREMARMVLPVALYTEFYATVDLHNLLHFIRLREDEHAQWEIQEYARAIKAIIAPIVPWTMEAVNNG